MLSYDRACPDKGIFSDFYSTNDGGIGADGRSLADIRGFVLMLADDSAARIDHIGKYHRWAEEYIVFAMDPGIYTDIVLYFDIVAQAGSGHHHHILPKRTIFANNAVGHDMREVPDLRAFTDAGAGVNDGSWMNGCSGWVQ